MRFLKGLCIVALIMAFAVAAQAETQSVKVSGDITMRGIGRSNFDLSDDNNFHDADGYAMTVTELQVDADLTDNVSATVRILNQRDWNAEEDGAQQVMSGSDVAGTDEFDIGVDLAYITLKEFFFTPLTVVIGRQDIYFGRGFIIAENEIDTHNSLSGNEWSEMDAFDAIRVTWDFDPWTLDGIYANIQEGAVQSNDDRNLWGLNLGCIIDFYNAETEVYWFFDHDKNTVASGVTQAADNDTHTFGARGSFEPHEDITIWTEVALQGGEQINATGHSETRRAWAADLGMECRMWEEQYSWKPVFKSEYMFFSGENVNDVNASEWNQFNPMYADGSSRGVIAGNMGTGNYYPTYMTITGLETDSGLTNRHILSGGVTVEPMENLAVDATFYTFLLHENASGTTDNKALGNELDVEMTYEYTEDVTFGLLAAWFWAGDYYTSGQTNNNGSVVADVDRSVAAEVVGSVALSF